MMVSEGDYTLRLRKANGVGIVAVLAKVVAPLAIMAVLACWAIPDSMAGLELSTKAAAVGEWSGPG